MRELNGCELTTVSGGVIDSAYMCYMGDFGGDFGNFGYADATELAFLGGDLTFSPPPEPQTISSEQAEMLVDAIDLGFTDPVMAVVLFIETANILMGDRGTAP
jgi:hypothetical protein